MSPTDQGALTGAGLGAATGAIIGDASGNSAEGALLGAAIGTVAGVAVGHKEEVQMERDAAIMAARESELRRREITMSDVVNMSRQGLKDDTILLAAQTRGCQIDMNPNNMIYLKEQGVSEPLIKQLIEYGN
ncbi:glycine zipper domain-containing protein [Polystyrenella longa]|nr:glycine zipper domain-containing protein [Polystyrenella longa]